MKSPSRREVLSTTSRATTSAGGKILPFRFFIDSTFPGEIWSDAEIQRGDFISYVTDEGRVSWFEVSATGRTGGAGGDFAPINSPVFTGDPKAPTPDIADNDTSVATTAFVKAALAAIPPPPATRYPTQSP
jgi:hypothetical protein